MDLWARWLSLLFDSSVLAVPVFLGTAWAVVGAFLPALGWAALALLFADGITLTYMWPGRRFGRVGGFDALRRRERVPFIAVNLVGNLLGYGLLRYLDAPPPLAALLLVYVGMGVTMQTISLFWKISLHAGGVGGGAAALVWLFGAGRAVTFLALPPVGRARVHRKRHSRLQVVVGGLVGAVVTVVVLAMALPGGGGGR